MAINRGALTRIVAVSKVQERYEAAQRVLTSLQDRATELQGQITEAQQRLAVLEADLQNELTQLKTELGRGV